jgi:hypothetical protein
MEDMLAEFDLAMSDFLSTSVAVNIDWSDEARADVRALERPVAMTIFEGLLP